MNLETQARSENQGVGQPRAATEILAGVRLEWLNHWNLQDALRDTKTAFEKGGQKGMLCFASLNELYHRPNTGNEGLGKEIELLAGGLKNGVKDLGELAAAGGGSVLGAVSATVFPENINLQQMLLETMRRTGQVELGSEAAEDRKIEQKLVIVVDNNNEFGMTTLLEKSLGIMEWEIVNGKLPNAEELEKTQREQRDAEREKILAGQYPEVRRRTKDLQQLVGLRVVQRVLNNFQNKQAEQLQRFLDSQEPGMAVPISDGELPLYNLGWVEIWQAVVAWNTIQDEKKMVKTVKNQLSATGLQGFSKKELKTVKTAVELRGKISELFADAIGGGARNEAWLFIRDMFLAKTGDSRSEIFNKINRFINPETVADMMVPESTRPAFEIWRESHPLSYVPPEARKDEEDIFNLDVLYGEKDEQEADGEVRPVSELLPNPPPAEGGFLQGDIPPVPEDDSQDWLKAIRASQHGQETSTEKPEQPVAPESGQTADIVVDKARSLAEGKYCVTVSNLGRIGTFENLQKELRKAIGDKPVSELVIEGRARDVEMLDFLLAAKDWDDFNLRFLVDKARSYKDNDIYKKGESREKLLGWYRRNVEISNAFYGRYDLPDKIGDGLWKEIEVQVWPEEKRSEQSRIRLY